MKKQFSIIFPLLIMGLAFAVGCMHTYSPTSSGGYGGGGGTTPTPTTAYTISAISTGAGYRYSVSGGVALSAPLTIMHGQSIAWDSSNGGIHPLYLDNGSMCLASPQTTFPYTYMFNTVGTYNFHCGNHGSCSPNNATCPGATCSGMYGTIVVQ